MTYEETRLERVKVAIAEKFAPVIDMRAPYARVMVDAAARAAIEATPPLELLTALTGEQRMELFANFCRSCGSTDAGCQCWNDE